MAWLRKAAWNVTAGGLGAQIRSLKQQLKEAEEPGEISAIVDALDKLEARYEKQKEHRKKLKDDRATNTAQDGSPAETLPESDAEPVTDEDIEENLVEASLQRHARYGDVDGGYRPGIQKEEGAGSNGEVIDMFVNDSFPKDQRSNWGSANVRINKEPGGWSLINYATPILFRSNDGQEFFNTQKYSVTTSKIQNYIRQLVGGAFTEVDEGGIQSAMQSAQEQNAGDVGANPPVEEEEPAMAAQADMPPMPTDQIGDDEEYVWDGQNQKWFKQKKSASLNF